MDARGPVRVPLPDAIASAIDAAIANLARGMRELLSITDNAKLTHSPPGESQMKQKTTAPTPMSPINPPEVAQPAQSERYDVLVVDTYEDRAGEARSNWSRVGVAFPHKDGNGMNVELQAVPVTGKLVIRRHGAKRHAP